MTIQPAPLHSPRLVIVAAMGRNRVIGNKGNLPWHLPEDLKHFRERTIGTAVLMGRRTFEALGHPLDNRHNVVLSRSSISGVETYPSLEQALTALREESIVHVIGGASVFGQTLSLADELVLTHVDASPEGDAYFPEYEHLIGTIFEERRRNRYEGFEVVEYERRQSA